MKKKKKKTIRLTIRLWAQRRRKRRQNRLTIRLSAQRRRWWRRRQFTWQSHSQHRGGWEEGGTEKDVNSFDNPTRSTISCRGFLFFHSLEPPRKQRLGPLPSSAETTIATTDDQSAAGQSITSAVLTTTAGRPSYCRQTRSPLPLADQEHPLLPLLRHVHETKGRPPRLSRKSGALTTAKAVSPQASPHPLPPPTTLLKIKGPPSLLQTRFVSRLGQAARLVRTSVRFRFGRLLSSKKLWSVDDRLVTVLPQLMEC